MPRVVLLVDILLICFLFAGPLTAQWVPTNGPYGGRVSAVGVASDSSGGKVFLAGGEGSPLAVYGYGIYRSTDSGLTWARSDSGTPSCAVYAFFAAGGYIFAGTSKGAYRSSDNGHKWELVNTGLKSVDVRSFAVRDTILFAGCYQGGVSRSTDWGVSWVNTGLNVHGYTLAVSGKSLFVGVAAGGVYRSTDDGTSWTAFNTGLDGAYVWQLVVKDTFLFAGTQGPGMFRSSVNTPTWQSINSGLPPISLDISVLSLTTTEIFVSLFDRSGLYRSTDNGTSWTSMTAGLGGREITALAVSDSTLLAATYGPGVIRSTDNGVSWSEANNGLAMADLGLLGMQGTTLFVGTGTTGAFRSTDNGDHWVVMDSGLTGSSVGPFALAPGGEGDTLLYVGTSSGVFRSTDSGVSWRATSPGPPWVSSLACNGRDLYAGCSIDGGFGLEAIIFRSTDQGMTWQSSQPEGTWNALGVFDLAFLNTIVFAATEYAGLLFSTDSNRSWHRTSLPEEVVQHLAVLPNQAHGMSIVAAGSQAVYLSADSGRSWKQVYAGLPNTLFRKFLVLPLGPASPASNELGILAPTNNGVYVSTDYGVSWTDVSGGLTNQCVGGLAASNVYLFAATQGGVVWRRPLAELVTSARPPMNEVPDGFRLEQNYPNPFNPTTTVEFDVPRTSRVSIRVYDLLGREVARLLEAVKEPGRHRLSFNAVRLASGVYLLRMVAGSYMESRKIVLLR